MRKISTFGLFCCDKFEEIPKQKVINMSKLNKFHFSYKYLKTTCNFVVMGISYYSTLTKKGVGTGKPTNP